MTMKEYNNKPIVLSVIIPCFNSAEYMSKAINSVLHRPFSDMEILIINDGSTDDTGTIADTFASNNPNLVRVIHQENKGHGGALNAGIEAAQGEFFKILDSDDWLNEEALAKVIDRLRDLVSEQVDLFVTDFEYVIVSRNRYQRTKYQSVMPKHRIIEWNEMKPLRLDKRFMTHSLIFRTQSIKDSGLQLPEHTFYDDGIIVLTAMRHAKRLYYMDDILYHYLVGRKGQSIDPQIMSKLVDQQIHIVLLLVDIVKDRQNLPPQLQHSLMHHFFLLLVATASFLVVCKCDTEAKKRSALWQSLQEKNKEVYNTICKKLTIKILHRYGWLTVLITQFMYSLYRKKSGLE